MYEPDGIFVLDGMGCCEACGLGDIKISSIALMNEATSLAEALRKKATVGSDPDQNARLLSLAGEAIDLTNRIHTTQNVGLAKTDAFWLHPDIDTNQTELAQESADLARIKQDFDSIAPNTYVIAAVSGEDTPASSILSNLLPDTSTIAKQVIVYAAIGAGVYLLWKALPGLGARVAKHA